MKYSNPGRVLGPAILIASLATACSDDDDPEVAVSVDAGQLEQDEKTEDEKTEDEKTEDEKTEDADAGNERVAGHDSGVRDGSADAGAPKEGADSGMPDAIADSGVPELRLDASEQVGHDSTDAEAELTNSGCYLPASKACDCGVADEASCGDAQGVWIGGCDSCYVNYPQVPASLALSGCSGVGPLCTVSPDGWHALRELRRAPVRW